MNGVGLSDAVLWVNITFLGIAVMLILHYVTVANSMSSKNYSIQLLRDKAHALTEVNGSLMSKKLSLESPTALLEYAKASNLVEAKNIVYIFENRNVARR